MYFLGLNTTKYGTNLHGIQAMSASVERSCFIKHTDRFTIYALFIKKPHDSKQKKIRFSAISMLSCRYEKQINQKKKKNRLVC